MERKTSWTLFTLRGVALNVHVSLLFLVFYVVIVATAQFPIIGELAGVDLADVAGSAFTWGLVFAFSLLLSIFIHEFSHVLVAQALGTKTRRVTLMMLGGASEMDHLPEEPSYELKVAIIGPLVSLVLGGVLLLIYWTSSFATLKLYAYWLGQLNIVLGIFNLLPAFPTDGGRVLRALLVSRQGRVRGTQNAVAVSRVFSWTFGLVGLLQFNLLLILIAIFISLAARSELFVITAKDVLMGLRVDDVMTPAHALSADESLERVSLRMVDERVTALPIIDSTDGHVRHAMISAETLQRIPKRLWSTTLAKVVADRVPKPLRRDAPLDEALIASLAGASSGLPVVENDEVIGLLRMKDLLETVQLRQLTNRERESRDFAMN
ncbi:MAG: site-2 protease family protein [Bdellovibrionota bacterium]